jgi:hypothetical protein
VDSKGALLIVTGHNSLGQTFPGTCANDRHPNENAEGKNEQIINPSLIFACLSQPDETAFGRIRNSK